MSTQSKSPNLNPLLAAGLAMPVQAYQQWKAQNQRDTLRKPPQLQPVAKTPYGVNKALAPPKPAQELLADPRLENPGPNALERPGIPT